MKKEIKAASGLSLDREFSFRAIFFGVMIGLLLMALMMYLMRY